MEKRLRIVEEKLELYGRRHDDCERERNIMREALLRIDANTIALQKNSESNQRNSESNQRVVDTCERMINVGENIFLALHWVGVASKWVISVGAALGAIWMGIKLVLSLGLK